MKVKEALTEEIKRRIIAESIPRIKQCLHTLTFEEIWRKPNVNSNSVGVLVLHLCGNVRQWILSGVCGLSDHRNREQEFSPVQTFPTIELESLLDRLAADLEDSFDLIDPEKIFIKRPVQCFNETPFSMILHAIEHFSYHTGQIVYYTKYLKDVDMAFYSGQDLNARG